MRESNNKNGFTQVDNLIFDAILPTISTSAQSVFLRIIRQTVGWGKPLDKISYSQFRKFTGIASDETIRHAILELTENKLVIAISNGKAGVVYGINWDTMDLIREQLLQKS